MHTFTKLFILSVATTAGLGVGPLLGLAPSAAMASAPSLTINNLSHSVVDHGDGEYTTTLQGSGVLNHPSGTKNTAFILTCDALDSEQTVECTGMLGVAGVGAPIALRSEAGTARYAISNGFSSAHLVAWEAWFNDALIEIIPPIINGGDGNDAGDDVAEGDGGDGGWDFPGGIIVLQEWTVRDYASEEWTIILDGVVMNPW